MAARPPVAPDLSKRAPPLLSRPDVASPEPLGPSVDLLRDSLRAAFRR